MLYHFIVGGVSLAGEGTDFHDVLLHLLVHVRVSHQRIAVHYRLNKSSMYNSVTNTNIAKTGVVYTYLQYSYSKLRNQIQPCPSTNWVNLNLNCSLTQRRLKLNQKFNILNQDQIKRELTTNKRQETVFLWDRNNDEKLKDYRFAGVALLLIRDAELRNFAHHSSRVTNLKPRKAWNHQQSNYEGTFMGEFQWMCVIVPRC